MAINCTLLESDLNWLATIITANINAYFQGEAPGDLPLPAAPDQSPYGEVICRYQLDAIDRAILTLSLASELRPELLDPFLVRNPNTDRPFSEFGGHLPPIGGFQPSIETALFLCSGGSLSQRLSLLSRFDAEASLLRSGLLIVPDKSANTGVRAPLMVAPGLVHELSTGEQATPPIGVGFPAQRIITRLTWGDLILSPHTRSEVDAIVTWMTHAPDILANPTAAQFLDGGLRVLFSGPPGTGKTLTATLLGQRTNRPVYRVDLSQVVSKWIGETEKNLATLFSMAEGRNWILFFDEADALFGARSEGGHANDRYANQEVSYLLQRIEQFDGTAILATNFKGNIDSAFIRRFQPIVRFSLPGRPERQQLWTRLLDDTGLFDIGIDVVALARDYEVTGAMLTNILRRALIATKRKNLDKIDEPMLRAAVERELVEAGKDGIK